MVTLFCGSWYNYEMTDLGNYEMTDLGNYEVTEGG